VQQEYSFPHSHIYPNWDVDELMALGILIGCQEHLWMMRSFVAQRTQLSCGAMASPHAAILTWRAFTCFSHTQKVPVQGCGWHFGAGDTSAHCGQGKAMKKKGMDKVHCA
jgi:hypothetical protein